MASIGGYEILDSIGQGGMGTVYKGRAPDGAAVALKLLHLHLCGIEEFVRRFHREAQLAERLAHPNVVRTLADGEEDGQHYLVMEFVEGRTLLELMHEAGLDSASVKNTGGDAETPAAPPTPHAGTAMPTERTIKWTRQIAGVLQAAADIGLVHRDLKPANVIVDARDNAKVLDFGLAKDTAALSSVLSMTGQSLGTPPYMSPEQFEGARDVDVRSDLYSLGATAYHLLTGQAPFAGPTQTAYMHQHLEEIPVAAEKVNPDVPRNLSWVLDRLLAKRPEDRHQTPAELIEDLNRVERGERPLSRYKPRKMRKHKTWHVVAAAGVAILLTLGAVGGWWWQRSANADTAVAERVLAAKDLAARSRLDEALAVLDKTIASYQAENPELVAEASALRKKLRAQRAAAETARLERQQELVVQGDAKLKQQDYAGALVLYQQAGALGETEEIGQKVATATQWKTGAEAKVAEAERIAREEAARKAAAAEAERQRVLDLGKALEAATRFLKDGDEDTLDQAREQAGKARELARSAKEIARVQTLRDLIAAALAKRRSWVGVVDFTVDRSVRVELTGSAVAVRLEQAQALTGRYRLVDRDQVARVLAELEFQASDLADRTKRQRFGTLVGAEYLVTGSVVQIGGEITVAAKIFKVATGAIRQTADNTGVSLEEINGAFFTEIARILEMTDAEKRTYLNENRNYPRSLAEGRRLAALENWDAAATAFEAARRAKRTPEVEALLATARGEAEAQRVLAERKAAHDLACAEGARLLRGKEWAEAEATFARALAVEGHEQSQEARDGLAKAQGGAALAAFTAAFAEGGELLAAERWAEAEAAFARALAVEGHEQSREATDGLTKARGGAATKAFDAACTEGNRLLEGKRWAEAEAAFARALAVNGHEQSQEARDGLAKAEGGAAHAAFDAACTEGEKLLAAKRWAGAEAAFARAVQAGAPLAADLRARAETGTAHAKLGTAVDKAEGAKGREDWDAVAKAVALSVPAAFPPAARQLAERLAALRKEAEGHLAPSLRVVCVLDGREVAGAAITVNGSLQRPTTPATLDLEEGKTYAFQVTLPARGQTRYTRFAKGLTADWKGEWELRAVVEEMTGPYAGDTKTICAKTGAGIYEAFPDVCRLANGDLYCVFYAGYGHVSMPNKALPKGGRICSIRSTDNGVTWGKAETAIDLAEDDRDPSVMQLPDGTLLLNFFQGRPVLRTFVARSNDNGKTWEPNPVAVDPPKGLDQIYTSAKILRLPDGTLLMPIYGRPKGVKNYASAMMRSTDDGRTWGDGVIIKDDRTHNPGHCEPALTRMPDGKLICHLRPCMCQTTSTDGGLTWTPPVKLSFPGHAADLLLTSKNILLSAHRIPGTSLHYSLDFGKTWSKNVLIDRVGGAYPSMVELPDGKILCIYYEEGAGSSIRATRFQATAKGITFLPW
jgi:sialidase-1